jgi:hypothetical protein
MAEKDGLKVVIKSADMAEEMQQEAIAQAKKALAEFHVEKVRVLSPLKRRRIRSPADCFLPEKTMSSTTVDMGRANLRPLLVAHPASFSLPQ